MKIGYNKLWGILFFLLDVPVCCLAAVFVRTGENFPVALTAFFWLFVLFGVLFLARTYIVVNPSGVSVQPLLGLGRKTFPARSARDLSVDGKDVFVVSEGERRRLPVAAWLVDPGGWASFLKWIQTSNQQSAGN